METPLKYGKKWVFWDHLGLGIKDLVVILRLRVCRAFYCRYDVRIVGIFYSLALLATTPNRDLYPIVSPMMYFLH